MALVKLKIRPGVVKDDSARGALLEGFYSDADKVRFRSVGPIGLPQSILGWEKAAQTQLSGKARALHTWEDDDANKWVAIGTNKKLYVYNDASIYDITPIRRSANGASLAATAGSATLTVTDTAHGASDGDLAYLWAATSVGGVSIGRSGTLSNPFTTINGSNFVLVTHTAHGLSTGHPVLFSGAGSVDGIPSGEINITHSVAVIDATVYQFQTVTEANATGTAGGGASVSYRYFEPYTVTGATTDAFEILATTATGTATLGSVEAKYEISPGLESSTAAKGYSTGTYSSGFYSLPTSDTDFRARVWQLSNFVNDLLANTRKGPLYRWQRNTSTRAALITATDIPTDITSHLVTPERHIMLLGCTDAGGNYDTMAVRWGTQANSNTPTGGLASGDWTPTATNTSRDFPLQEGSRLIKGLPMPFVTLLWTDTSLYQARYLGDPSLIYGFDLLGQGCGLIGPNAAARVGDGGQVYWLSNSRQFYGWAGGRPQVIPCPVRDFFFENLAPVQEDLIVAGTNGQWNEVWWFYPDSTNENARYVAYNYVEGHWTIGTFDITAWVDRGVLDFPLAAHADGYLYLHERENSADGAAFAWSVESAPLDVGDGETLVMVRGFRPDVLGQMGGITLEIGTALYASDTLSWSTIGTFSSITRKLDFRKTARFVAFRLSGNSAPTYARLAEFTFDVVVTGQKR
jgi:hypothetical protein